MDLVLTGLIALLVLILFLKGRRRPSRPAPRRPEAAAGLPAPRRAFFSRHGKEDWRYWRDLAITLALGIAFLAGLLVLAGRGVI